ncbi:hypothetical protein QKW52_14175 [Bacillus sonorensis]|nr:hypothetical protein [Bacillus sonorensis]
MTLFTFIGILLIMASILFLREE